MQPVIQAMRIACQLKVGPKKTFNNSDFDITAAEARKIPLDENAYNHFYNGNLTLINRIWQRTVDYFIRFVEKSPSNILGKVFTHFSRLEFQSPGSLGKL